MSPKAFTVLLAAALLGVALAAYAVITREVPVQVAAVNRPLLPELGDRLEDIAAIAIVSGGETVRLRRVDDRWVVENKGDFPVDPDKVRALVLGLAELRVIEAKTDDPEKLARLELEEPGPDAASRLVRLFDDSGAPIAEVVVGKRRFGLFGPGKSGNYVRLASDTQAWLADRPIDALTDPLDWVDRNLIWLPRDDIAEVRVHIGTEAEYTLARTDPEGPFQLLDLAEGEVADVSKVERVVSALGTMTLTDIATRDSFPFPEPATRARYTAFDGLVVDVTLYERPEAQEAEEDADSAQYWVVLDVREGEPRPRPEAAAQEDDGEEDAAARKPLSERVAELRSRYGNWTFRISRFLAERLLWQKEDLLEQPSS